MAEIHITGWRPGLQKVSMTRLIREQAEVSLKTAKEHTDSVLEKKTVILSIPDEKQAQKLAYELEQIGAVVEIMP